MRFCFYQLHPYSGSEDSTLRSPEKPSGETRPGCGVVPTGEAGPGRGEGDVRCYV